MFFLPGFNALNIFNPMSFVTIKAPTNTAKTVASPYTAAASVALPEAEGVVFHSVHNEAMSDAVEEVKNCVTIDAIVQSYINGEVKHGEQFSFVQNTNSRKVNTISTNFFDIVSNKVMSIENAKFWDCGGTVGQLVMNDTGNENNGKTVTSFHSKVGLLSSMNFAFQGNQTSVQIEYLRGGKVVATDSFKHMNLKAHQGYTQDSLPAFDEIRFTSNNDSFKIDEMRFAGATGRTNIPGTDQYVNLNNGDVLIANGQTSIDTTPRLVGHLDSGLETGQYVQVYRDGKAIGKAMVSGTKWTFQDGEVGYGCHDYVVQVMDECECPVSCAAEYSYEATCYTHVSPLAIDLNGDGVKTLSVEDGVAFDLDASGDLEQAGWIDSNDGLLALDVDGNGSIDSGKELFGNFSANTSGSEDGFKSGWDALKQYDSNHDNVISKDDSIWQTLKVWVDANTDGVSQAAELKGLDQLGLKSIDLNHDNRTETENDNKLTMFSTVAKVDGSQAEIVDVYFQTEDYVPAAVTIV